MRSKTDDSLQVGSAARMPSCQVVPWLRKLARPAAESYVVSGSSSNDNSQVFARSADDVGSNLQVTADTRTQNKIPLRAFKLDTNDL
jgi:hypothetical protein